MKKVLDHAESRGIADHGWLYSRHTFSFADYHNPERMGFGKLRVINDDVVAPGEGFATHPHDNMEIISIPIRGVLRHQDSMGNQHVIETGDIQIMSAGSGLTHSEYNASDKDPVNFLQIWVRPKQLNIEPRYGQKSFAPADRHNAFQVVISPDQNDPSTIWINQDAWFVLADFDKGFSDVYPWHASGNGVYVFVISGEVIVGGEVLAARDAIGVSDANTLGIRAIDDSRLLLIEVPMS
jgi:redox-sensitive bicupin YhaK (pirin superfamily)